MPSYLEHAQDLPLPLLFGTLVAAPATVGQAGVAATVSLAFGKIGVHLPDQFEPSVNDPRHRRFFHSWAFLLAASLGTAVAVDRLWEAAKNFEGEGTQSDDPMVRADAEMSAIGCRLVAGGVAALGIGIALHLLSDALTQKGLPLI